MVILCDSIYYKCKVMEYHNTFIGARMYDCGKFIWNNNTTNITYFI